MNFLNKKKTQCVGTVFIFGIFRMYKNYYCEIMRPPSSEALAQVCHLRHGQSGTESEYRTPLVVDVTVSNSLRF